MLLCYVIAYMATIITHIICICFHNEKTNGCKKGCLNTKFKQPLWINGTSSDGVNHPHQGQ